MARCEDHPACGHVDGLPCDWTPDYESIWAHIACEHEAGYCALEDRDDDELEDPRTCGHRNAYQTRSNAWCCDDCLADLALVVGWDEHHVVESKVVPGVVLDIPVLSLDFVVTA